MANRNFIPSRLSRTPLHVACMGYQPPKPRMSAWQMIGVIIGYCVIITAAVGTMLPIVNFLLGHRP